MSHDRRHSGHAQVTVARAIQAILIGSPYVSTFFGAARWRLLLLLPTPIVGLFAVVATLGWGLSAPGYSGPTSSHFDGTQFANTEQTPLPGPLKGIQMMTTETRLAWEHRQVASQPAPPERVFGEDLQVTFINHATVLIQTAGLNILTDPIWSERCSASQWVGPRRFHDPPFPLDELPPIDIVLISHNHYDHLDINTLQWLAEHHNPKVYAGLGNGAVLRPLGLDTFELDWGQRVEHGAVTLTGTETRHFSSRGAFDQMRTLWLGFAIETPGGAIYFGGDTGYGKHFTETGRTHGPFRLALLPIGAYAPKWFMGPIHQDPAEAVQAHLDLRAQTSVGIHFGTFQLTFEGQDEPVRALAAARDEAGLPPEAFRALLPGEGFAVP